MRLVAPSRLWLLLVLGILVALVYWPSTAVLYAEWSDFVNITFTHGWLILAVSLFLIWRDRREIASAPAHPWPLALIGLAGAIPAWMISYRAGIQDLHITIYPALFWFAVAGAFGWPVARLLLFPVAFFCFALPSWAQLGDVLQELTVLAMRGFLGLTGPHAVIDGALIHIPNGSFAIEEGCSGLHFMIVGLAVAALHGELRRDPWRTRLAQLALMAGLALLANWVRVYVVIEAGYLTDMRHYLVSVSHYWFGWAVFGVALFAFFWLSTWFTPAPPPQLAAPVAADPPEAPPLIGFALAVGLLLLLPGASLLSRRIHPPAPLSDAPLVVDHPPWSARAPDPDSFWVPHFEGADRDERVSMVDAAGGAVEIFRVSFLEQRQGAELVGESGSLLGGHLRWRAEQQVSSAAGIFRETEAADPTNGHSLIWSRYRIGGRPFVWPLGSQLWYGLNALVGSPLSTLIAVRAECRGDCEDARRRLGDFVASEPLR